MRSSVDGFSIANEIRLSRTVRKKASALLVEGAKVRLIRRRETMADLLAPEML